MRHFCFYKKKILNDTAGIIFSMTCKSTIVCVYIILACNPDRRSCQNTNRNKYFNGKHDNILYLKDRLKIKQTQKLSLLSASLGLYKQTANEINVFMLKYIILACFEWHILAGTQYRLLWTLLVSKQIDLHCFCKSAVAL